MKWLALVIALPVFAQQTRMASDFEIRQMEAQAARAKDFASQVSAHLNLGDLRDTRNEHALAVQEYTTALHAAEAERSATRGNGQPSQYAVATMYAGLAEAELGDAPRAMELAEEGIRYEHGNATLWNVYSATMGALKLSKKALSAARNAVALETQPIGRIIDHYSLAISLEDAGERDEAMSTLENLIERLRSDEYASLRREAAKKESFENYSTVRSDVTAYLTILVRAQEQLASLYERRGDLARAKKTYEAVLQTRTDDPIALAALARLSNSAEGYTEAFDANPFSLDLIEDYKEFAKKTKPHTEGTSTGAQMRMAIEELARGEDVAARHTLEAISAKFPDNDAVAQLLGEIHSGNTNAAGFLKNLADTLTILEKNQLTPEQRKQLDLTLLASTVVFDATPFLSGTVDGVPFRFSAPVTFRGNFTAKTPLRLTYHILGATELNGASALLLEPVKLEPWP